MISINEVFRSDKPIPLKICSSEEVPLTGWPSLNPINGFSRGINCRLNLIFFLSSWQVTSSVNQVSTPTLRLPPPLPTAPSLHTHMALPNVSYLCDHYVNVRGTNFSSSARWWHLSGVSAATSDLKYRSILDSAILVTASEMRVKWELLHQLYKIHLPFIHYIENTIKCLLLIISN